MKMNFKRMFAGMTAVCLMAVGCTMSAEDTSERAEPAAQESPAAPQSSALNATTLLRSFEDIAVELEAREVAGQLAGGWMAAWSNVKAARQDREVAALVSLVRSSGSSEDLLAAGSDVIEAYLRSFDAVLKLLDSGALDGTLDARWAELHTRWASVQEQVGQSDGPSSSQRARDFCCVVHMDPPVECFQWHTAAVWAGPKCVSKGVGLNRSGSSLYGGSCADHPECL
ncbi:hypothetical protein [Sorangium sp. So ce1182]|uniref:hypothetical protein n=1 Tax=Sorangium sp. So ce1182 TaxID=3133334 RepID=UPI003F61D8B8